MDPRLTTGRPLASVTFSGFPSLSSTNWPLRSVLR